MYITRKLFAGLAALVLAVGLCPASLYTAAAELTASTSVTDTTETTADEPAGHWYTSPAGNKFYFDADGNKLTGWQVIDGNKYYFRPSGVMQTMWAIIDGNKYYFGKTGVMRTMWETIGGNKYYFGKTGVMRTMWETIGGNKYYFGKTGVMRTMWETIGGNKYYFGKTGVMRTMWETIGGNRYYFGMTGVMRTMWENIGTKRYYFGMTGVMRTGWETIGGNRYYFGLTGVMRTGWQVINGKNCYFNADGIYKKHAAYIDLLSANADSHLFYNEYTLFDINGDGTKELIMKLGTAEDDALFLFYTLKSAVPTYIGMCDGSHTFLRVSGGKLYTEQLILGQQNIDQVTFNGTNIGLTAYSRKTVSSNFLILGTAPETYNLGNPVALYQ